jgi:predicted transcriptional regulator
MRMPPSEVDFFEWLKHQDEPVWNDIWAGEPDLYLVSTDLLPVFQEGRNGFPICDLVDQPNYWFSERHIKPRGREELELIALKYENQERLDIAELFLIELINGPIDIWHFCYRYNIAVQVMKRVIATMVAKGWLVHLTDRDDLVKYIEI